MNQFDNVNGVYAGESPALARFKKPVAPVEVTEEELFSSVDTDEQLLSAVQETASKNQRSLAASIACEWAASGETDAESLGSMIVSSISDDDDEADLSDEEQDDVHALMSSVSEFLVTNKALDLSAAQALFDDGCDDTANAAAKALLSSLQGKSSDEAVADFAERESFILSAVKKVIRDGKVELIKTKKRKKRMSPAQKAALKKARKKAHGSAGKAARKKSNRMRKSRGMK